jgi:Glycosyl hydrolase catalytic core
MPVFKRVALILVLVLAAAGVAVVTSPKADSASGSNAATYQTLRSGMLVGFYDDEQVYGRTDWAFKQLRSMRAGIVRITIDWANVARRRPAVPADPADPAYNWTAVDHVVSQAALNKVRVLAAIYGTPRWAGRAKNRLPRRMTDLRLFAFAAAKRYSGTYRVGEDENEPQRALPAVRHWLAWNEPNNPVFLKPQWKMVKRKWRPQSAFDYAKICSAVFAGVHATRLSGEKVACGATGPRGNDAPRSSRPSTSPLVFMTWLRRAGLKRFDAYAHHPYYGSRLEKPTTVPRSKKAVTLGNIGVLIKQLNRLYGRSKRLWITEYGYQTRPPDRHFGVRYSAQAKYVHQAFALARKTRRIDMLVWFLVRDELRLSGWQSGVVSVTGKRKPSFRAFQTLRR